MSNTELPFKTWDELYEALRTMKRNSLLWNAVKAEMVVRGRWKTRRVGSFKDKPRPKD